MDELCNHLEQLNDGRSGQTRARHSSSWLQAVSVEAPESIEYDTTQDRAILDTFFEEYIVQLQSLQQNLWVLQDHPEQREAVDAAFRVVHTLKGNCGFMGAKAARKLAHEMENILSRGRERPLGRSLVELLLRGVDALREIGVSMAEHSNDTSKPLPTVSLEFAPLLDHIRRAAEGGAAAIAPGGKPARSLAAAAPSAAPPPAAAQVPLRDLFERMIRAARAVARREEKEIDVRMDADSALLEHPVPARLGDPLLHLANNAVTHGTALPAEREAAGKSVQARIVFRGRLEARDLLLEVSDDGNGLDCARILMRARERGLLNPAETLSEQGLQALIFTPGFSTAASVSESAGRGVGLDVVKTTIEDLGGAVSVASIPGRSTTFLLRMPIAEVPANALAKSR